MPLKFLCDENLPNGFIFGLAELGHDVKRLSPGTSDTKVATCAKRDKRILLTLDGDFANILAYPPGRYLGIIRFKLELPTVENLFAGLSEALDRFPGANNIKGKLIIISSGSLRVWGED